MTSCTLRKEERLRGKRVFSHLFEHGRTFFQTPYKVFWTETPETGSGEGQVCFAVSVPKRRFKRAVKRNLMKRRSREVFRTNKQTLSAIIAGSKQIHLLVIYSSDILLPFAELETSMKKILQRIAKNIS